MNNLSAIKKTIQKLNPNQLHEILQFMSEIIDKKSGQSFSVSTTGDHTSEISDSIHTKFGNDKTIVSTKQENVVGVNVSGAGYYYKRTLDNDIAKLLK